jgi:hypothetical protein
MKRMKNASIGIGTYLIIAFGYLLLLISWVWRDVLGTWKF